MIGTLEIVVLIVVALLGHVMALIWFMADKYRWPICSCTIYAMEIPREQLVRELKNSVHTPIHAVFLAALLYLDFFNDTTIVGFVVSFLVTTVWAEIWHYWSHRLFHLRSLLWIHREHHKSRLNSPLTAISFSFTEKFVFNIGILGLLAAIDRFVYGLNFFGVAGWYIAYLFINSFSHANFELKSKSYLKFTGKLITSTTYHALHHSRYINNYGLGTRVLDRLFGTEWPDYEPIYERVSIEEKPLVKLAERIPTAGTP
jgi:sterol desaturase/sphingolipid hydroxylase (fatty acid hydroxylase superfamily)